MIPDPNSLFGRWVALWRPLYHNITTEYEPWESYLPVISEMEAWLYDKEKTIYYWATEGGLWTLAFPAVVLYLAGIFGGQRLMRGRKAFELRAPLIAWNALLCVFSALGIARLLPEFLDLFKGGWSHGLYLSVCTARICSSHIGVWALIFSLSKFVEFFDTAFIVLRKRPLIFLHYFHHVATFLYCTYSIVDWYSASRWFALMNMGVHTLMYGYFALKAAHVHVPLWTSMTLTGLQVMQMVVGTYVNYSALAYLQSGVHCEATYRAVYMSMSMYAIYVVMFGQFFIRAYLSESARASRKVRAIGNGKLRNGNRADSNGNERKMLNGNNAARLTGIGGQWDQINGKTRCEECDRAVGRRKSNALATLNSHQIAESKVESWYSTTHANGNGAMSSEIGNGHRISKIHDE